MQCPWIRPVSITLAAALAFAAVRAAAEPPAPGGSKSKEATVGIGVGGRGAYPRIFFVIPDMPAGRSGKIHKNDLIIAIGQGNETPVSTEHMNGGDAGKLIRGPKGTVVTLKVVPEGKQLADASTVSLTRGAFAELSRFGDGKFLKAGTKAPSLKARSLITGGPDFELKESGDRVVVLCFWGEWLEGSIEPIDLAQRLVD